MNTRLIPVDVFFSKKYPCASGQSSIFWPFKYQKDSYEAKAWERGLKGVGGSTIRVILPETLVSSLKWTWPLSLKLQPEDDIPRLSLSAQRRRQCVLLIISLSYDFLLGNFDSIAPLFFKSIGHRGLWKSKPVASVSNQGQFWSSRLSMLIDNVRSQWWSETMRSLREYSWRRQLLQPTLSCWVAQLRSCSSNDEEQREGTYYYCHDTSCFCLCEVTRSGRTSKTTI